MFRTFLAIHRMVAAGKPMTQASLGGLLLCASAVGSKDPTDRSAADAVPQSGGEQPKKNSSQERTAKKKSRRAPKKATTFGGGGGPTVPRKPN